MTKSCHAACKEEKTVCYASCLLKVIKKYDFFLDIDAPMLILIDLCRDLGQQRIGSKYL